MGPGEICDNCLLQVDRYRDQLPHLKTALRSFLGGSLVPVATSKVSGSPTPSTPVNIRVLDLLQEITDILGRIGNVPIYDLPAGEVLLVRRAWKRADSIVGLEKRWSRRHASCPECHLSTLGNWVGDESVHCTNSDCAIVMSRQEYEEMCQIVSSKGNNV